MSRRSRFEESCDVGLELAEHDRAAKAAVRARDMAAVRRMAKAGQLTAADIAALPADLRRAAEAAR